MYTNVFTNASTNVLTPRTFVRYAFACLLFVFAACSNDDTAPPALETLTVTLSATTIEMGQTTTATASGEDQNGDPIATGTITWSSSAEAIATVNSAGVVTGVTAGTARIIATAGDVTGERTITVNAPPALVFNEVESNGDPIGDWAEIHNPTAGAVDISGWKFRDNDATHTFYVFPAGTTIAAGGYLVVNEADFGFGLGGQDSVSLFNQYGVLVTSYPWDGHAATTYGRCPNATGAFTVTTTPTKGAANDCSVIVKINEIESSGGTPGDWIELYNPALVPANLGGFIVRDNDDTHTYTIPAGTTLAPGAYLVIEESALGFGLGTGDNVRLFAPAPASTLIDSYTWTAHAATTYGRCPNGTGAFETSVTSTKGAANACTPVGPVAAAWPGTATVETVDLSDALGGDMSGLTYEAAAGGSPAVLWAIKNDGGVLYRLIWNGTIWTPETTNGWIAGKTIRYPGGTGSPDSEGLTFAATSAGGIYVSTERDNSASSVSKNSILRVDPTGAGTTLTATNEWNITSDLPSVGANLGIEAITWVPDAHLVGQGFFDESKGHAYTPAEYPNHGTGLFFVGVEGNGIIYVYALNHATNGFTRVATIVTGFPGVMGLEFDRDTKYFWVTCDNGCDNKAAIFQINTTAGSPTLGRFVQSHLFNRPTTLPNVNNEGFALAPESECVAGQKPVFWSDDDNTGTHAIRRGSVKCRTIP